MKDSNSVAFRKIRKILEFVWASPYSSFYRNKYKKAGIDLLKDINSIEDFNKLPFLTRDEIMAVGPYDRFYFPKQDIRGSTHSNTTGGKGMIILLKGKYPEPGAKIYIKKTLDLKIKTAMTITYPNALWAAQNRPYFKHKSIVRYSGNVYNLANTATIIKQLKIEAIAATPSILESAISYFKKETILDQIKFIHLSGEYCSRIRLEYFRKTFKNAYVRFGYASIEANGIGYQCDNLINGSPQIFHPQSSFYYELINPKKESELVLTHLKRTEFPLIRYKIGDMVNIYKDKCACGKNSKIEVFGRIGMDVIKVSDYYIYREQIDNALYPFIEHFKSLNWKLLILDSKKSLPKFKLQLISKKKTKNLKLLLEKEISKNVYLSGRKFSDLVQSKVFSPLEVEFVGAFETALKQKAIVYSFI